VSERIPHVDAAVEQLVALLEAAPSRQSIVPTDLAGAVRAAMYVVCFAPYPVALRRPDADQRERFAREIADMITRYMLATKRPT